MEAVELLQLFLEDSLNNFYIILVLLLSLDSYSQEAHILFNRVNMGVYNPAFIGTQGSFVSFNSRSQWSGIYEKTGGLLPVGSYYYRIDLVDGSEIIDGWIYLTY
jgi:hypothetical protein